MVFINITTYNSMKYLPEALRSIFSLDKKNFKVLVIDNGSTDGTVEFIRDNYPEVLILKNVKNRGFATAHNQGIKFVESFGEKHGIKPENIFILITNPDIILTSNFLEKIINHANNFKDGASFGGKLYKIFINQDEPTDLIDSTGLKIARSRRFVDRGAGKIDKGQYKTGEIFGNSGALVLYRLSALKDIEIDGQFFDERFFVYKEDVDLAWRIRMFGWKSYYIDDAIAYHYRGAYGSEKRNLSSVVRERRAKNELINYYSTRNHIFTIFKNDFLKNIIKDFHKIFFYEISKFLYILFFETKTLKAYYKILLSLPQILKWRKKIMTSAKIKPEDMRRWIF